MYSEDTVIKKLEEYRKQFSINRINNLKEFISSRHLESYRMGDIVGENADDHDSQSDLGTIIYNKDGVVVIFRKSGWLQIVGLTKDEYKIVGRMFRYYA